MKPRHPLKTDANHKRLKDILRPHCERLIDIAMNEPGAPDLLVYSPHVWTHWVPIEIKSSRKAKLTQKQEDNFDDIEIVTTEEEALCAIGVKP